MRGLQPRGEIYKGSVPALADSTDRFLDLDTKQSVINLCDIWSSNIHHIMNEPSVGMYRIAEHVRTKVPMMVEQKNMLKTKKVNEKIYDADYAILACKSINTNTPWIFSDSIRILKNNFVSVPLVQQQQQPNAPIARKQPRPTQQQSTVASTVLATSSPQQPTSATNPPPPSSSDLITTTTAISSSISETQVATQSANSIKSGNASTSNSNTILTVANSNPLILEEPSNVQIIDPQQEESINNTPHEQIESSESQETTLEESSQRVDPIESVPTIPTTDSSSIVDAASSIVHNEDVPSSSADQEEEVITTTGLIENASPTTSPATTTPIQDNEGVTSPMEVQVEDEWSALTIHQPSTASAGNKKKKSTKKKKKATTDVDEELTPRTF